MRNNLVCLFILLISLLSLPARSELPEQIVIGLNPGGNPEVLRAQGIEFAKELQAELGVAVNIFAAKDYLSLVEAMKSKKVDFAFFSSMTFVKAEEQAGAKVLLKKVWTDPFYFSALIVRADSKIKKIGDIKGKKIVYVDQNSASGYLYPQVMLQKKSIHEGAFSKVIYSGNHSSSIAMLEKQEADVAAVFSDDSKGASGAWTRFAQNKKIKYRVLWVSDPIPNDPFCVRKDFYEKYPKFTHNMMFAMIDIFSKSHQAHKYYELLGSKDLMPATSRQYDPVREMVKSLNLEGK